MRALYTAATGMAAQELNVQVISNNIANMRTTGYKKQRAAFQDLIYDHVRRIGAQASDQGTILPVGIDIGGGAIGDVGELAAGRRVLAGEGLAGPGPLAADEMAEAVLVGGEPGERGVGRLGGRAVIEGGEDFGDFVHCPLRGRQSGIGSRQS